MAISFGLYSTNNSGDCLFNGSISRGWERRTALSEGTLPGVKMHSRPNLRVFPWWHENCGSHRRHFFIIPGAGIVLMALARSRKSTYRLGINGHAE
jgi:hypothetical protein